jgi:FkbM family methyltransferase
MLKRTKGRIWRLLHGADTHPRGVYIGNGRILVKSKIGPIVVSADDLSLMPFLALYGTFEDELVDWLAENLQSGDTFVDVGANIGWFTVVAAQAVGANGTVVAIEPDPRNYELLLENASVNYVAPWVTALNVAAWHEPGSVAFHRWTKFRGNSSLLPPDAHSRRRFPGDTTDTVTVESIVLDMALDHLPRIDVLKMDIEGAEIHALVGMNELIESRRVKSIVLEVNRLVAGENWPAFSDWILAICERGWTMTDLTSRLEVSAEDVVRHGDYANVVLTR